jgi:hypothetical protein
MEGAAMLKSMMLSLPTLAAAVIFSAYQPPAPPMPDWKSFQFLIGTWAAQPDPNSGGTTIEPDLQGRVLVRRNFSLTGGSRHEDLMIIRYDGSTKAYRADYLDNEGHIIHYRIDVWAEGRLVFISNGPESEPRYRLTYKAASGDTVNGVFEIAPPGPTREFRAYLTWSMKKTSARP